MIEEQRRQAEEKERQEQEAERAKAEVRYKEYKVSERKQQQQIKDFQEQLEKLKQQLKEKEQLQRITNLKLTQVKREIKHNQLKPIKQENKPTPVGKGSEGKPILEASPVLTRAITGKPNFVTKKTIIASKEEEGGSN